MRKRARTTSSLPAKLPLDNHNDFTSGVESQRSHLADFAALRGCSVVEAVSAARTVPPALGMPAFATGYEDYHWA